MTSFFKGLADVKRGLVYLFKTRSLYKFVVIPFIVNLLIFALLGYLLSVFYGPLYEHAAGYLSGLETTQTGWLATILSGFLWMLKGLLRILLGLFLMGALVIGMVFISQIINSPIYDLLSEAVEKREKGIEDLPFSIRKILREAGPMILLEIKKMAFFLLVPLVLFLLNFIPVVGTLLYILLANLFAAWAMGYNFVAYPMGRRVIPFKTQIGFASSHKARLMGFGLPLLIPFFNLLLAPAFVVGGTLIYLDEEGPGLLNPLQKS